MEHQNNLIARLSAFEAKLITGKWMLRLFAVLVVLLALAAGLGWEQFNELNQKYNALQVKHDRLNRIYLQQIQR